MQTQLLEGQASAREAASKAAKEVESMRRAKTEGEREAKELQEKVAALNKEHKEALRVRRGRIDREMAELQARATAALTSAGSSSGRIQALEKVELDLPRRRINAKRPIAFKDGVAAFSEPAAAGATLDAVAAALNALNAEVERMGLKHLLLSVEAHTADEDPALSISRATACREHVAKRLSEMRGDASSPADIQKLLQTIGHGNKAQKKAEVVMRVILDGDEDGGA